MNPLPKVSVVILNYNGKHYLEKFLPVLLKTKYDHLEIVIGDNASTDDSISFMEQLISTCTINSHPIRIIINDKNYGFAEGYNQVLKRVEADYYVLLNSDVEVTENWIAPLLALVEKDHTIAAVQPKIRAYHTKTQFEYAGAAGGFIDKFGYPFCRGRLFNTIEEDNGQYDDACEVFWATGAAMFVRANLYHEVGGLDGDFFAHMEEIDFCWRLKNRGYKIVYCPQSIVYHVGGGTLDAENPRKTFLNFRNSLIMLQKNLPFWPALWIIFVRLWLDLIAWFKFVAEGKWGHAFAINKAHAHFWVYQPKWIQKRLASRHHIQNSLSNTSGGYHKSIVFDFFIRGKRKSSELNFRPKAV